MQIVGGGILEAAAFRKRCLAAQKCLGNGDAAFIATAQKRLARGEIDGLETLERLLLRLGGDRFPRRPRETDGAHDADVVDKGA